jgi:hypothetical protein
MKILLLALLLVPSIALAKQKPKLADYNLVAKMTYHAPHVKDLREGRTDLFYDGDYTCTPGDEHHAPDCRTYDGWLLETQASFTDIFLADGRRIIIGGDGTSWCTAELCKQTSNVEILNKRDLPKIPPDPSITHSPMLEDMMPPKDGGTVEFRYRLLSSDEIEIMPRNLKK